MMDKLKKFFAVLMVTAAFSSCGSTTVSEHENKDSLLVPPASEPLYRDSVDLKSATETGGGTANPAANSDSALPAEGRDHVSGGAVHADSALK